MILWWNWTTYQIYNQQNLCWMYLAESRIKRYFKPGIPLRNFQYSIMKLWFQNIYQTKPIITVTQVFLHWIKHWPWPYLNSRYYTLNFRYLILYPYIIIYWHWPNISGQYFLRNSQKIVHQICPCHSYHILDGALCFQVLMLVTSPNKTCIFSASQTSPS